MQWYRAINFILFYIIIYLLIVDARRQYTQWHQFQLSASDVRIIFAYLYSIYWDMYVTVRKDLVCFMF